MMNREQARNNMLLQQIRTWGVIDQGILNLLAATPREKFVPAAYQDLAFTDMRLPIGLGQEMLTPAEEARILQALQIQATDKVLEIGTGSGYMTALLAKQAKQVYSFDLFSEFIEEARAKLTALSITNVVLHQANAAEGWPDLAPFDVIVITGSFALLPTSLKTQLNPGGRLFAIVGQEPVMTAQIHQRLPDGSWHQENLFDTVVPRLLQSPQPPAFAF